jgi:hypothetical protein
MKVKRHSSIVTPSSLDLNIDIEAQMEVDVGPNHKLKTKINRNNIPIMDSSTNESMNERVDLLLRESTNGVLRYNYLLQFTSSSILLDNISVSQEYYHFRHSTVMWQYEYTFSVVALLYYLVVGNIREMFFHDKTNYIFFSSFLCVIIASIFAIVARFGGVFFSLSFNEVKVKWLFRYCGIIVTRVQLYELIVFFSSVLSANLNLLARVVGGKCPNQDIRPYDLWSLQYCNPMAMVSTPKLLSIICNVFIFYFN